MNFIYFEKVAGITYPIGGEFNDNFDYIREAARTLHTVVDKDEDIALVCRGTSGCIIASAVGYILKKKGRKVTIVRSRKTLMEAIWMGIVRYSKVQYQWLLMTSFQVVILLVRFLKT